MKRLYFLIPDADNACQVVAELETNSFNMNHVHAIARYGVDVPCVNQATLLQTSQFGRGIIIGLLVGGIAGFLAAWLAIIFPPPSFKIGNQVMILCIGLGATLGAIIGGMITKDRLNPEILPYEGAILRGSILLILDVASDQINNIVTLVRLHHPEAVPYIANTPRAI